MADLWVLQVWADDPLSNRMRAESLLGVLSLVETESSRSHLKHTNIWDVVLALASINEGILVILFSFHSIG